MLDFLRSPLGVAVLTYLATGIATALFKPRSEEEYARLAGRLGGWGPRFVALLKAISALGLDVPKLVEGLSQIRTNTMRPPSMMPPPPKTITLPAPPFDKEP